MVFIMSSYVKRDSTTSPSNMIGNPFYYNWNVFQPEWAPPVQIGNCTWYAWGRFWEISGATSSTEKRPTLSTSNAEDWWGYTRDGYERGQIPKLGAVLCFRDGAYSGWGHVAIVEEIEGDGSIWTSESALNGYYFQYRKRRPPDYAYDPDDQYIFQGFIYNPYAGDTPGTKIKPWLLSALIRRKRRNDIGKSRLTYAVWNRKSLQL